MSLPVEEKTTLTAEDERIAVNHTLITRELFMEGYAAVFPYYIQKRTQWAGMIMSLAGAAALIICFWGGYSVLISIPFFACGLVVLVMGSRLEKTNAKKSFQRYLAANDAEKSIERTTTFYATEMHVLGRNNEESIFLYEELTGCQETENILIIQAGTKQTMFLDRKGFVLGSFEDVRNSAAVFNELLSRKEAE